MEMFGDIGVKTQLQQFEPGGNILAWRQGKQGDWDLLGNGFSSPTGLAITMMQGMYAGTAEKEKTRDTYQGYVVPDVQAKIQAASSEVDPGTPAGTARRGAEGHLGHLALRLGLRAQVRAGPPGAGRPASAWPPPTPTRLLTSGWRPEP